MALSRFKAPSRPARPRIASGARHGTALVVHGPHAPGRASIQAFVTAIFKQHYDADVLHWAPWLVGLMDRGSLVAAAGYRRASEALFLEQYLESPVEQEIVACTGRKAVRDEIFEVGHLASSRPGAGKSLMSALAAHLAALGCRWVVSTATFELRLLFDHLGVAFHTLGSADARALGEAGSSWGTYYEHAPVVVAGELAAGLSALSSDA